ncbi:T4SS efffector SepA family protein [Xanthobacter tagetidis]|uniref:T4SS efffector SepA family protein n=1 Tax=Xanthobacter tagetidis TaxID=60216 RepID=UPI0011C495B8|nr:hypothetical protein [Xanthobacter tagetidis]MBB6306574.1 hypothetical protein [Xanthobacter tagetidis]
MPVSIALSEDTYRRLQAAAEPFVDNTPESVIVKLLRAWESKSTPQKRDDDQINSRIERESFDPRNPPSLTHTKVSAARIMNESIPSPTWNGLMDSILILASDRLGGVAALRRIASVNLTEGAKGDEGYRYVSKGNFSVQGQDANSAWRAVVQIADRLQVPTVVEFEWRVKPEAQFPGTLGRMTLEF